MSNFDNYFDNHYIHKTNWLRAAVLGANNVILSVASIAIGVAMAIDFCYVSLVVIVTKTK
ncbi:MULTISPECIES: hypothetical protein [Sphingobacterium]|uniref:hypothetical protein n=1 Tax=Sphingobacterium TaxID=28453 RepID=UPI000A07C018|nr:MULTISPECIES: hypothetical protein [Sphingobacterium]SUI97980.1 Uncharacterised protein [Sphingobacterium multivorum]HBW79822.1 hypothetical protein [Sphingobacterium sp.]